MSIEPKVVESFWKDMLPYYDRAEQGFYFNGEKMVEHFYDVLENEAGDKVKVWWWRGEAPEGEKVGVVTMDCQVNGGMRRVIQGVITFGEEHQATLHFPQMLSDGLTIYVNGYPKDDDHA
jgi:hypothetical protein